MLFKFTQILFKQSIKIKQSRYKNTCFHRGFEFIKKNVICKAGPVTKVKLVRKIKKNYQLHFGTSVLASLYCCGDNSWNTDFFQNAAFKKSINIAVKKNSD